MFDILNEKIITENAKIGVIGMGYVGLPLAVEIAKSGLSVVGIDVDSWKIEQLLNGHSYIQDVSNDVLKPLVEQKLLTASNEFSVIKDCDAVSICVPTPLRKTKDPDISFILNAVNQIKKYLHKGQLIVLESTTYPGTTDEVVLPILNETGLEVGKDFFLAFSPERVDPGNVKYHTRNTPKIIGGITKECSEIAKTLYSHFIESVVTVSSTKAAEMVKLLENTFRSVNIGLVNEIALMCDRLNINVWEVIDAAATKPFGFMPFYPGPGLGGHCIPIDPVFLSWKLKTLNYTARFIELASEINANMPRYVVSKIVDALNKNKKSVNGSKILILGLSYKKDINDTRESPSIDIYQLLFEKGADIDFSDPYVPEFELNGEVKLSVKIDANSLSKYDCTVIATNHTVFNITTIVENSKLIVDARDATKDLNNPAKIIRI